MYSKNRYPLYAQSHSGDVHFYFPFRFTFDKVYYTRRSRLYPSLATCNVLMKFEVFLTGFWHLLSHDDKIIWHERKTMKMSNQLALSCRVANVIRKEGDIFRAVLRVSTSTLCTHTHIISSRFSYGFVCTCCWCWWCWWCAMIQCALESWLETSLA